MVIVFERQNLSNKKEGQVSIEIKKKPTESNVTFHVFLVSEGFAQFEGADLEGIFVQINGNESERYRFRRIGNGNGDRGLTGFK